MTPVEQLDRWTPAERSRLAVHIAERLIRDEGDGFPDDMVRAALTVVAPQLDVTARAAIFGAVLGAVQRQQAFEVGALTVADVLGDEHELCSDHYDLAADRLLADRDEAVWPLLHEPGERGCADCARLQVGSPDRQQRVTRGLWCGDHALMRAVDGVVK